ncbi:putative MFS-type transporter [Pseudomonas chlororaphis subsp. aurantiaca]|uniref:MFS transporter n=1 Tax=Pseudomonas chlororaphis TaxID=587753 RepID=UPI000F587F2D|nr:MFS transporter [Pseudomonas chlororaphis]AZD53373.1 putative MFS-type transporter [Pseudomonas chlororaphis subsp. aurantiaca]
MDTMTENDYLIAWGLYAFAALGCLLVWMRLTRWMWRWLREPLRVLVAVLLFSPTVVDPAKEMFAPAVAITALDMLFKVGNNAWRAVSDLFMYGVIAFGIYLVFVLIRWPIERASKARKEQAEAAQAAARAEEPDDQPFGCAGDDRYGRPPVPSNPQRSRIEPRL